MVTVTETSTPLQDIDVSWVAPVEREDGTPITMAEIAGYRVYYGTEPGLYTNQLGVTGSDTMAATLSGLASGTYYITITTLDSNGRESAHSLEINTSI
jgi:hypothetical protein